MHDKTQRINVTPQTTQDFEMVKHLAELHGATWSQIGAKALNQWLEEHFLKLVQNHQETKKILRGNQNV